jgi:S1-C subfamily serine protease
VVLSLVVLGQGILLARLEDRVDRLAGDAADTQRSYQRRVGQLEDRTDALTDRLRRSVDPAAVAKHALPATYRVVAGHSSGTAFAVARAPGGGTYLLTNHHVVDELPKHSRTVKLDHEGAHHTATVVETDAEADVAVLKTGDAIPVLSLETEQVIAGEPVLVIGAPVGLEDTVTTGVVSKVRPIPGRTQEYIQFDAAINPGNSGGPVLNAAGRVVGIATAKAMDAEGIGFALPIGVACDSFDFVC